MKKYVFIIYIIAAIASTFTNAHGAEYYLRADGTAANKDAATGPCTSASSCMTMATLHDAGDAFFDGDIIYLCDDGGEYRGTRQILNIRSDGGVPSALKYMAYPGDTPIINGSDVVAVGSWTADGSNYYWQPPLTGDIETERVEPMQVWEDDVRLEWKGVCSEDSATPCDHDSDCTGRCQDGWTGANNPVDENGEWSYDATNQRVYIRPFDGTLNDELIEVGQRNNAINMSETWGTSRSKQFNDHVIVDGITIKKVAAKGSYYLNPHTDGNGDYLNYTIIASGCNECIVRNCNVSQVGGGEKFAVSNTSNWSVALEYYNSDGGSVYNNTFHDCGYICVSMENIADGTINGMPTASNAYVFYNNIIYDANANCLSSVRGDGSYYNNNLYNCGQDYTPATTSHDACMQIYDYDQFDGFIYGNMMHDSSRGLLLQESNASGIEVNISYNLFYNFSATGVQISDNTDNADFFNNVLYDGDGLSWVLFYLATGSGDCTGNELRNNIFYSYDDTLLQIPNSASLPSISNNIYYRSVAGTAFNWSGTTYTYANYSSFASASGDVNSYASEPKLVNIGSDFRPTAYSAARNAGFALSGQYANALDPTDATFPYDTVKQWRHGSGWEIGAFAYVLTDYEGNKAYGNRDIGAIEWSPFQQGGRVVIEGGSPNF